MRAKIKIPATSANLGPGFDTLAIAWNLFLEIYIDTENNGKTINYKGEDVDKLRKDDNLFIKSLTKTLNILQENPKNYFIEINSQIPIGKGLGSSSAVIWGGILSAEIISDKILPIDEKFKIAYSLEGHFDNLAGAFMGGLTLCTFENDTPRISKFPFPEDIYGIIFIPPYSFPTEKARSILPLVYPREKIVQNLQYLSFLLAGLLYKDEELIRLGLRDEIHQPYRFSLIPEVKFFYERVMRKGALGVVLSGAGPSLLALAFKEKIKEIEKFLKHEIKREKINGKVMILEINKEGIKIEKNI